MAKNSKKSEKILYLIQQAGTLMLMQRNHVFCSIVAFLALEVKRIHEDVSWYKAKHLVVKDAIGSSLKSPTISLNFA